MFDQSLINRCSDGLTPHIQMVYNNLYIWCLLEAYSLCMCFVLCFFFFFRLRGAEGARLQSREVCRLRGLRGFDCCGGHQPRCEDHPCWWRSPHHRGTRMLTHTYKLLLMLIFFLFYQMTVTSDRFVFILVLFCRLRKNVSVTLNKSSSLFLSDPAARAVGSVWFADRWQPL